MGIPHTAGFKEIAIIAAGGKRPIGKTDNFVHFVRGRIRLRSAGSKNFTADFNQIVLKAVLLDHFRNLINPKPFCNGR